MSRYIYHADSEYKVRQKLQDLGMGGDEARVCVSSAMTSRTRKHNCGVLSGWRVIVTYQGGTKFAIETRK